MKIKNTYKLVSLLAFFMVIGCSSPEQHFDDSSQVEKPEAIQFDSENPTVTVEPEKPLMPVSAPNSGVYNEDFQGQEAIAPLEIKSQGGSDYYVKVVDAATDRDTLTIYIRCGDTVEVDVPLGSYEIRYAAGDTWYGEDELFGPETSYNKADELFTFSDTGYQISGYTITLYQVVDGNLETIPLDKDRF